MNKVTQWLRYAIYGITGALVVFFVSHHYADFKMVFSQFQGKWIFLVIPLQILMLVLAGYAFQCLSQAYQFPLRWQDWMGLSFIANFMNQLLPYRPGIFFRYFYLKKHYAMPLKCFAWVMSIYLCFTVLAAIVFLGIGWWFGDFQFERIYDLFLFLGLFVFFFTASWLFRKPLMAIAQDKKKIIHRTIDFYYTQLTPLLNSPMVLLRLVITFALSYGLISLSLYLCFISIQYPISLAHCLFLSGMLSLISLAPVTAGNLGVNESVLGALTQLMYHDFSIGFSAALIYRVAQWIPGIILGSSFSFYLIGKAYPPPNSNKVLQE